MTDCCASNIVVLVSFTIINSRQDPRLCALQSLQVQELQSHAALLTKLLCLFFGQ